MAELHGCCWGDIEGMLIDGIVCVIHDGARPSFSLGYDPRRRQFEKRMLSNSRVGQDGPIAHLDVIKHVLVEEGSVLEPGGGMWSAPNCSIFSSKRPRWGSRGRWYPRGREPMQVRGGRMRYGSNVWVDGGLTEGGVAKKFFPTVDC